MPKLTNEIKRNYTNRVLELRLSAGYKRQKEFAADVGIAPSIICDIESNRKFLSSVYALRIADVLGCRMDDLFQRKTRKTPIPDTGGEDN